MTAVDDWSEQVVIPAWELAAKRSNETFNASKTYNLWLERDAAAADDDDEEEEEEKTYNLPPYITPSIPEGARHARRNLLAVNI